MVPDIRSKQEYLQVFRDDEVWLPAIRAIASRHALSGTPQRTTLGTNITFACGDYIVKLFPPPWRAGFAAEKTALEAARGLPVPEVAAEGELEGWPYLIMTRLGGVPVGDVWPSLDARQKHDVVAQIGELMRKLHDLPVPHGLRGDWQCFLNERLAAAEAHHNVGEPWRSWLREQLRAFSEPPRKMVLLHGDLTADHILLRNEGGNWSITGLIDFGDARVGHPYYEFAVPLVEYVYGQPGLAQVLLDAYGLWQTAEVEEVLTRYCLVHEFVTLRDFLERHAAGSPEEFLRLLWR